eukprot:COSAG02_NODE_29679_length_565_cov_0.748927_1_plen_94_part_00
MEQEKTAPDVAPPQESAELGDDGEVRDDDPMLLDVLGEIGLVGACAHESSRHRALHLVGPSDAVSVRSHQVATAPRPLLRRQQLGQRRKMCVV